MLNSERLIFAVALAPIASFFMIGCGMAWKEVTVSVTGLVTLPGLLARDGDDSLHFWVSTFDGLRREMFPRLVVAYASGAGAAAISAAATAGSEHFAALAKRLPEMDESAIEALSHEVGSIAL